MDMIQILGVLLFIAMLGVFLWLLRLPASYQLERRQRIASPAGAVYQYVLDYPRWTEWSPWLLHDPGSALGYHGQTGQVGSGYSWQSAKIGQGSITTTALAEGQRIEQDLRFIKPFKSQADVRFTFSPLPDGASEVCWSMSSRMPIFMRPFIPMFTRMIGYDFELGLARMAGALDPSAPHPRIRFLGVVQRPEQRTTALPYSGPMDGLTAFFKSAYPSLYERAGAQARDLPLAAYHRVDIKNNSTQCDAAVPVADEYSGSGVKTIAGGRFFHVRLQGDYRFLGCTWNAAMGNLRMNKYKFDKSRASLEVYGNDMRSLPNSNDWITDIYVAIK